MKLNSRICCALALTTLLAALSGCAGILPILPAHPLANKTEADVVARRESLVLDYVLPSPDGSQLLYSYHRRFEVDLRMGAAIKTWERVEERQALWLRDASGKERRLLDFDPGPGNHLVWLGEDAIAWQAANGSLVKLSLSGAEQQELARSEYLDMLQRHGDKLYFVRREGVSGYALVRLDPATGVSQSVRLPAGSYMYPHRMQILDAERVLVDMTKPAHLKGDYAIATSPAMPLQDGFLVDFKGGLTRLTAAPDRSSGEDLIMAPDQSAMLVQGYRESALYGSDGSLRQRIEGRGFWIDSQRVLSLSSDYVSLYTPGNLTERFDRPDCSDVELQGSFALVQCQAPRSQQAQVYRLDAGLKALSLGLSAQGNASIGPAGILTDEPGAEGYAAFYRLDAKGEPQQVFKLTNPAKTDFKFDPKANWSGGY